MAVANQTSGSKIRQARLAAGMTQTALARAINTSERNIVRWETDRNAPRFEHVVAIAQATGQEVGYFTEASAAPDDDDEESDPVADLMAAIRRLVKDEVQAVRT